MRKFRQYAARFALILCICAAVFAALFFALSSTLAQSSTLRMAQRDVLEGVQAGIQHLETYAADAASPDLLSSTAASPLIPRDLHYYLLDNAGQTLWAQISSAQTAPALDPLASAAQLVSDGPQMLLDGSSGGLCLAGQRTQSGIVLVAKVLDRDLSMMELFRTLLISYSAPLSLVMVAVILFLYRRIFHPVDLLVNAIERVSGGEPVEISEKLPMELRPLGRALTQTSQRLSSLIGEIRQERDTVSLILEGLDEGVIVADAGGDILRENRMTKRLLGSKDAPARLQVLSLLQATLSAPQPPLSLQHGERMLLCVSHLMPERVGAHRSAIAVVRDVTEHERLERTRREYVANISHELRTPLASMRGIAEGLCDGLVLEEEGRHRAHALILSEIKRLSRLVNDLLELSSLQSGGAAFDPEEVDVCETLWVMHDRGRALLHGKALTLRLDVPEKDLPPVTVNEDRLQQVIMILLDNAIKFTPEGGEVVLGAQETARGVRFFVRDTGIGMDEQTQLHVFERFHQADTSHSAKGSGLGLAIAHEITKRLGTRIHVHSAPGQGSEFSFLIR